MQPSRFRFRIHEPGLAPRVVPVEPNLGLGRSEACECSLQDRAASGWHAIVKDIEGRLAVIDLGSTNQTKVRGGPVLGRGDYCFLEVGQEILIGRTVLEVLAAESTAVIGAVRGAVNLPVATAGPGPPRSGDSTRFARAAESPLASSSAAVVTRAAIEPEPVSGVPGEPAAAVRASRAGNAHVEPAESGAEPTEATGGDPDSVGARAARGRDANGGEGTEATAPLESGSTPPASAPHDPRDPNRHDPARRDTKLRDPSSGAGGRSGHAHTGALGWLSSAGLAIAFAFAALGSSLTGCASHELSRAGGRSGGQLIVEGVEPQFAPAMGALGQAVADHEDDLARNILRNVLARIRRAREAWRRASRAEAGGVSAQPPAERALEIARGFERVLDGRECSDALTLELRAERVARSRTVELRLWLRSGWPRALDYRPGAATLAMRTSTVGPDGRQAHQLRSTGVTSLGTLRVAPGAETVVSLGRYEIDVPVGALAVREEWSLTLRAGEVFEGDRELPIASREAAPIDWSERALFLPAPDVEPEELLRFLDEHPVSLTVAESPEELEALELERLRFTAPLMERAVRIASDERQRALELLRVRLGRATDEEIARLAPVLRWLTATTRPSGDPELWRAWARGGALAGEESEAPNGADAGLVLPRGPRRGRSGER